MRYVAINDNVYKINEKDLQEYLNIGCHPDNTANNDSVAWCDKIIAKYKPYIYLDVVTVND